MNSKFDELAKRLAQSVARCAALKEFGLGLAGVALAGLLAQTSTVMANDSRLGPLIELSRPNAVGTCDTGFPGGPNTFTLDDAVEPYVAVNPVNPRNVVAAWIQGLFQNIVAAVSLDGGHNWQQVPIPITTCSGGAFLGTADVWLSFAPNGDLYAVCLGANTAIGTVVSKSTDGGLHWSVPSAVSDAQDGGTDHPSITADPNDSRFVYVCWQGEVPKSGWGNSTRFSRTTDGGRTWEPPRVLIDPPPQEYVQFSQVLVLPDGTLVTLYSQKRQPSKVTETSLRVLRSTDRGQTWSEPNIATIMTPLYAPSAFSLVVDPETGESVIDLTNPSFAVDKQNGALYAVWDDGRFSNFQYNDIAFSMSADGGRTWSTPIRINQTPLNIPAMNRQAFLPAIAVADDGTIAVSHYDFRFNDASPGLPMDRWLVRCHPSLTTPASNPASWGSEVRLTDASFNLEACKTTGGFVRIGEYYGLAALGSDFVSTFTIVNQENLSTIVFRRISR